MLSGRTGGVRLCMVTFFFLFGGLLMPLHLAVLNHRSKPCVPIFITTIACRCVSKDCWRLKPRSHCSSVIIGSSPRACRLACLGFRPSILAAELRFASWQSRPILCPILPAGATAKILAPNTKQVRLPAG